MVDFEPVELNMLLDLSIDNNYEVTFGYKLEVGCSNP